MERVGEFHCTRWGTVGVWRTQYAEGQMAIVLTDAGREPLATLSVNMYKPECSQDAKDLPPNCFYAKEWSENAEIAADASRSGLFKVREDLPPARSGFVEAWVWELL